MELCRCDVNPWEIFLERDCRSRQGQICHLNVSAWKYRMYVLVYKDRVTALTDTGKPDDRRPNWTKR